MPIINRGEGPQVGSVTPSSGIKKISALKSLGGLSSQDYYI